MAPGRILYFGWDLGDSGSDSAMLCRTHVISDRICVCVGQDADHFGYVFGGWCRNSIL